MGHHHMLLGATGCRLRNAPACTAIDGAQAGKQSHYACHWMETGTQLYALSIVDHLLHYESHIHMKLLAAGHYHHRFMEARLELPAAVRV